MLEVWKKKRVLKKYLKKLPLDLANRYGSKEYYSVGQLETTLRELNYPKSYHEYAAAIFLSEEDAYKSVGNADLVKQLIEDIAELFLKGDKDFNMQLKNYRSIGNVGHCSIGVSPGD